MMPRNHIHSDSEDKRVDAAGYVGSPEKEREYAHIKKEYTNTDKDTDYIIAILFLALGFISVYAASRAENFQAAVQHASSSAFNFAAGAGFAVRKLPAEDTFRGEYAVPAVSFILPFVILNMQAFIPGNYGFSYGLIIALPGIILGIISIVYLRSSFAILPAVRRVIRAGPYAVIRHPLYLGEMLYVLGFMFLDFSVFTLMVYIILFITTIFRIHIEEKKLLKYPEYNEYAKDVKYRLIPGIY